MNRLDASNSLFVYAGLAIYVLAILIIGYIAGRKIKSMSDFLVAGRRLPFWMATATLLATWFGAGSSMGVASTVYTDGIGAVISDPFAASISLILAGFFIVGPLRKLQLLTVTEVIERRYGKAAGAYASLWMIPVYVGWLGAQVLGIGTILNLLFGLDPVVGSCIGAGLILAYTIAGGMWAVTLTDVVQVSLIIAGLVLIIPGALEQAGGMANVLSHIPPEDLSLLPQESGFENWVNYAGQWCIMGLGCMVGQDLIQRSLSSRTDKIAKNSSILAGFGYMVIALIPLTIGFSARIIAPDLESPDSVLPHIAQLVLHPVIFTIFLCALISAIMSSADSSLLAASSLITNNVLHPFHPDIKDREMLYWTRGITLAVTLVALGAAIWVESIYSLMINCWSSQLVIVFFPVVAALYLPKSTSRNCWTGMLTATVVWLGTLFFKMAWSNGQWIPFGEWEMNDAILTITSMYGFVAGVIAFFISYIFHRRQVKVEL